MENANDYTFNRSRCWLENFKRRYEVTNSHRAGGSASANKKAVEAYRRLVVHIPVCCVSVVSTQKNAVPWTSTGGQRNELPIKFCNQHPPYIPSDNVAKSCQAATLSQQHRYDLQIQKRKTFLKRYQKTLANPVKVSTLN